MSSKRKILSYMKRLKMLFYDGKLIQVAEKDNEVLVLDRAKNVHLFMKDKYGMDNLELFLSSLENKK